MNRIVRFALLPVVLASSLLAGCGDPQDATDGNYSTAINEVLKKENPLCYIVSTEQQLPWQFRKDGRLNGGASIAQLSTLVKAGLLTAKDVGVERKYEGINTSTDQVPGIEYSLTPAGQAVFRGDLPATEAWPQGGAGFCFGEAEVDDILNSTDPKPIEGGSTIITDVTYLYKVKKSADWADNDEVRGAFPDFAAAGKEGKKASIRLERRIDGWVKFGQ